MATDAASVAVVVPFATTDPDRIGAWDFLRPRWPWPVVQGAPATAEWCKAEAVTDALGRSIADVLVIADADVWCDGTAAAVEAVQGGAPWAVPHRKVHRLDATATAEVLRSGIIPDVSDVHLDEPPYVGHAGGGILVVRRDVYEDCPLDPRFRGWGQEDDSLALALRTLHGAPWRGRAALVHLWHRPLPRQTRRVGSAASKALWIRYSRARRQPDAMRKLLAEVA